ncbi:MAG: tRNA lysidine(34) synthetase TilS, partial [Panacagrimonas sp.]
AVLLREIADADIAMLADARDGALPVAALLAMSAARRRNLVRAWVLTCELPVPGHETLEHLDRDVLCAARDATPVLAWPGGEFRRHGGRLFALSTLPSVPDGFRAQWDGRTVLALPEGCGALALRATSGEPERTARWTVRLARPADRFRPSGSARTRTLKNLFQEGGVPTWVRERTPLVALGERPVWVGGFGWTADDSAHVAVGADIEWRHRPAGAPAAPWRA